MKTDYEDDLVFRVAELFLQQTDQKQTVKEIADLVNREFSPHPPLTRESVYPLVARARKLSFLRLTPPLCRQLEGQLSERYPALKGLVRVVHRRNPQGGEHVAAVAAEVAAEIVRELRKTKAEIGLGLGPGRATLDFCRHFGALMANDPHAPKFKLVAISAGCPAETPAYAPIAFFNLFPDDIVVGKVGLFAETLVLSKDYPTIKTRPGVKEAFQAREAIDLVVTSMGDINDEHDLLTMFLRQSGIDLAVPRSAGWVGNVQYRPYTAREPVKEKPNELRAVTLFELADLVQMSKLKNKHVILIARQCGICDRTRAEALRPVLTNPALQVFSRIVMDTATAKELLQ